MYFDQAAFGNRIREERLRLGMTQTELAEKLNISRIHMSQMENGRNGCSLDLLLDLSDLFGRSTDYLIRGKDPSDQETRDGIRNAIKGLSELLSRIQDRVN